MIQNTCQQCGKEIDPKRKFCSRECQKKFKRVTLKCENCGKEVIKRRSEVSKHNYCNKACRFDAMRKDPTLHGRWGDRKAEADKNPSWIRTECANCGVGFRIRPDRFQSGNNFCNLKCLGNYRKNKVTVACSTCHKKVKRHPSNLQRNKSGKFYCSKECMARNTSVVCDFCNKEFEKPLSSLGKDHNYCSRTCFENALKNDPTKNGNHQGGREVCCELCGLVYKNPIRFKQYQKFFCSPDCLRIYQIGKNHPNWVIDRNQLVSRKSRTEVKEWAKAIYNIFDYTCQLCGKRKESRNSGMELNAHHIKAVKHHPELELDLSNGICLCKRCHHSTFRKEKEFEEKFLKMIEESRQASFLNPQ